MTHAPVAEAERADVLDALRAFALLGIFISHVPGFSGFEFMSTAEQAALDRFGANAALDAALQFFIDGKFFSLFSLLFGIGFAVQIESAMRAGRNFTHHFSRRLAILFAIGVAHALVWYGDILKDYTLIGFLLLVTARWTPKSTAFAAAAVLLLRALWPLAIWMLVAQTAPLEAGANPKGDFFALTQTFAGADPAAIFVANLELLRFKALQMLYEGKAISILAMFLVGAYIGKRRLYRDLTLHEPLLRKVFAVCLPIGIIGNALLVPISAATPAYPPSPMWVFQHIVFAVAVPAMTLAYVSGFALLWTRRAGMFLRALAPAGRMALTTYVSQSLIGVFVFYGIGLSRRGAFGLAECITFALAVFVLQCAASALWFSLFRFGPLEWLWRRATYGTPLPMLRSTSAVA